MFVCLGVFHTKVEVGDGSCARVVRSEALLFGAEYDSTLDVAGSQYNYTSDP